MTPEDWAILAIIGGCCLSPHIRHYAWFLVTRLVYTGPGLRIMARSRVKKMLRIANDVGVDMLELAGKQTPSAMLLLIQRKIAEESYLLVHRTVQLVRQAEQEGLPEPDAALIVESLERHRAANAESAAGVSFYGFLIPPESPLVRYRPKEIRAFNDRMRQLKRHWEWTSEWLWQARKAES